MRPVALAALLLALLAQSAGAHDVHSLRLTMAGNGSGRVSSPSGVNCASSCVVSLMSGVRVTLTATPDSGSTFAGWSGGPCAGPGDCTLAISGDVSVTATFNTTGASSGDRTASRTGGQPETFTLTVHTIRKARGDGTVTSTPPGIACGTTCAASYPSGAIVTLRATPASGAFLGWGGARSAPGDTMSVVMNASTHVTASFGPAALEIVTASPLPAGRVGSDYAVPIRISGGTARGASFRIVSGSLPPGLRMRVGRGADTALITGRPTRGGTRGFTLRVTRGGEIVTKVFSLTIER